MNKINKNLITKTVNFLLFLSLLFFPIFSAFANDQLVATITGTGASAVAHTVSTDHLTGSNVVTNSSGTIEELTDYYPYGEIRLDEKTGSFSEQRKFTGYEYDGDTGLNYAGSRYYEASTGRFISQDPAYLAVGDNARLKQMTRMELERYLADPQLANSYSYAVNNPLKYTDPTGDFIDIALDVGFIGYDLYKMGSAAWNGNWGEVKSETVNLGLDAGSAFVPGVTGLGMVRRAGEAAKVADKAVDARKLLSAPSYGRIGNYIPRTGAKNLPQHAQDALSRYEATGFKNSLPGYEGGRVFGNKEGYLPNISDRNYYREWDANGRYPIY